MNNRLAEIFISLSIFVSIWILSFNAEAIPPKEEEEPARPLRARLLFAGDVMCHTPQISAAGRSGDGNYDFSSSFEFVRPMIENADVAIVNLETTISPDGRYSGYPMFSSPPSLAVALKEAGADIALMANNHCCDRLLRGIKATTDCLDSLGIARTGVFRDSTDYMRRHPLRFMYDSISFALFDYTYGTNGINVPKGNIVNIIDTLSIRCDLESAADADCRIVCIHWGDEYSRRPNRSQRSLAEYMRRHGANIIVGSHPHVIQPVDTCISGVTLYSLGNFVSNQRRRYCDGGLVAEIDVEKNVDGAIRYSLSLTPVWVKLPGYRILPPSVADTMQMRREERATYEQFISDTESLLAGK